MLVTPHNGDLSLPKKLTWNRHLKDEFSVLWEAVEYHMTN